ncbi:hypothetical protein HYH02_008772 [Chlamydomonas schloesseri]|uniref:N-acetyltransferase domain-containing protein n=1 Tax=Chlamydomonas schloesseri TaxID=2026947 RepID=A0A835WDJ7_9CHLO|nr:hypothetical protein HYH02_008772 [Chlamydomonas schloesseri]|eukprot:KAG2445306.1 hypothetical protein HYH02_008772 [Chlamydomonas schloesseri]
MMAAIQRLDHSTSEAADVEGCLEVIAEAFAPMHSTPMYLEDPAAQAHAFWRTMAREILYGLQPSPHHPPLYVIPASHSYSAHLQEPATASCPGDKGSGVNGQAASAQRLPEPQPPQQPQPTHREQRSQPQPPLPSQPPPSSQQPQQPPPQQQQQQSLPAAAALAYLWRPDVGEFHMPATEAMLRREALADWEACGELWHQLLLETYERHGEFINVDFIGVRPRLAGGGHGRALLAAILADADAAGRAVFLAACGPANAAWYERHGFVLQHHYTCSLPGVPGHADLRFQVRPPRPAGAHGGGTERV